MFHQTSKIFSAIFFNSGKAGACSGVIIFYTMNHLNSPPKFTTAQNLTATPINLPVLRTRLVGRDKELGLIRNLLLQEDINLVTLTGLGGAGKTSLALQVASSLLANFSGGVFFVGLASLTKSEMILIETARILKVEEDAKKNILQSLKDVLSGRQILLVLDNFEHLMQGALQVGELLQTFPLLKIMVTSREPLRLRSEQTFPVHSLSNEHSVELFTKRAQSLNPDFSLSKEDTESVVELCKRLDGLPLAIELAALRTKLFTLPALLARLKPDLKPATPILDLLSFGARDLPKRQQSLRNTIAWSYGLLQAEEQLAFRTASIFPAGFSVQTLSSLLIQNENDVLEVVSSLVDKNLIKPSLEKHDEPRFILLDTIREYAWEEILRFEELEGLKEAYVDIYLSLSEQADSELKGDKQSEWFNRLDDEFININLAIEICLTSARGSKRWTRGYEILYHLHRYWMLHGHFHLVSQFVVRARSSMDEYIKTISEDDQKILKLKANIYSLSGSLAWAAGNYMQASDWHEIAYDLYKVLNDKTGMADALNNWAANLGELGEYEAALKKHEMGLVLNRKDGDLSGEMRQLNNMGGVFQHIGRATEALVKFEEGLRTARKLNDRYFIAMLMHNIAHLKLQQGDFDAAISLSQSSLEIAEQLQTPNLQAWSLTIIGLACVLQKNIEQSKKEALESIKLSERITDAGLKIQLLQLIIYLCTALGKASEAAQMIGAAEKIRLESGYKEYPVDISRAQKLIEKIRLLLSENAYEAARANGMKMTFESALAFAANILEEPVASGIASSEISLLTVREREVLILISRGLTNEQISSELVVVLKTVEKHTANILRKLGVKNRTEAAAWAIAQGLSEKGT